MGITFLGVREAYTKQSRAGLNLIRSRVTWACAMPAAKHALNVLATWTAFVVGGYHDARAGRQVALVDAAALDREGGEAHSYQPLKPQSAQMK